MAWLQKDKMDKVCYGVDLNRNWDYKWSQKGSSKSPCNEFYAGPNVFSEPETRAVSKFLMDNRRNIKVLYSYILFMNMQTNFIKISFGFQFTLVICFAAFIWADHFIP